MATGAGVGSRHQLEARGQHAATARAGDVDDALLEDLSQALETPPVELGKLVEEQDTAVRQGELACADGLAW